MFTAKIGSVLGDNHPNCMADNGSDATKDLLLTLCRYSIAGLVLFSVALPAGSISGIPVKHFFYLASFITLVLLWIRGETLSFRLLSLFIATSIFVLLFTLIGFFNGASAPGFVIREASGVFTAISLVLIVELARERRWIDSALILSAAFWGSFIFATFKSVVGVLLALELVPFDQVYFFFLNSLNYRVVSAGIFGGLVRINLIIYDFLVGIMLFITVAYPNSISGVPKLARYVFVPIGLACLLFAYSRLLFFIVVVLFCYAWIFRWNWRAKIVSALMIFLASLILAQWIEGAFEQRFIATQNNESDRIRVEQIDALLAGWAEAPLVGGGFGYYAKDVVRDYGVPYSYEVQWIGFLAKLGSIGIIFLLGLVGLLYMKVMEGPRNIDHFAFLFTLSCFILGGLTNQYLAASGSGAFYCIHLAMGEYLRLKSSKS